MPLLGLDKFPEFSKNLSKNKWADYIELLCLTDPDKEKGLNDILIYSRQENILQEDQLKETIDGDEDNSERTEKYRDEFLDIFKYFSSRFNFLNEFYPFECIGKETIKLSDMDDNKLLYIYFLLSSNTRYFIINKIPPLFTSFFEHISHHIMKIIYPNFKNEIFGTANKPGDYFYGGTLLDKLTKLSLCLGTSLTKKTINDPHNSGGSGDKGLDIISYFNLDINPMKTSYIPLCFGQCSCSYDEWKQKQSSISKNIWDNRINDLPSYHEYLFVPFSLRGIDGYWAKEEHSEIQTIIIDRFRFLNILKLNKTNISLLLPEEIKSIIINFLEGKE
ncbi:hypothetical protein R84B8_00222 [Treponema sp. R8-4-B8]